MTCLKNLRPWISSNFAPIIFLSASFFAVVLSLGHKVFQIDPHAANILYLNIVSSADCWALLFLPFLMTPLIVVLVRRFFERAIGKLISKTTELFPSAYSALSFLGFFSLSLALWRADAFVLFVADGDVVSSIEARFQIQEWMGFPALAVLMSMCLVVLNIKWSIIVYCGGPVLAIFVCAKLFPYVKAVVGDAYQVALIYPYCYQVFIAEGQVFGKNQGMIESWSTLPPRHVNLRSDV